MAAGSTTCPTRKLLMRFRALCSGIPMLALCSARVTNSSGGGFRGLGISSVAAGSRHPEAQKAAAVKRPGCSVTAFNTMNPPRE